MKYLLVSFQNFYRYRHLLQQLVERDVKLKYRRSFLGYLWSILNPLMVMVIMVIVFSNMFRFEIENFPVYLIVGQSLFNFLTESTTQAINSIIDNATLLKKTYVPKYIFTIAKISSSLVNLLFSLGAMLIVLIVCRVRFTWYFIFIPVVLIQIYLFCLGLGLFLAQGTVFFRDIRYIYNALITAWTYLTPLFYPITALPVWLRELVTKFNPMYFYITQMRIIVMEERFPPVFLVMAGFTAAGALLLVGSYCFGKTQDKFILYI